MASKSKLLPRQLCRLWRRAMSRRPRAHNVSLSPPLPGGLRQRWWYQELRRVLQVQCVKRVDCCRVAPGERWQVPLSLDELEDGSVVVDLAGHVPGLGVR